MNDLWSGKSVFYTNVDVFIDKFFLDRNFFAIFNIYMTYFVYIYLYEILTYDWLYNPF